jgi:hypothetical protein
MKQLRLCLKLRTSAPEQIMKASAWSQAPNANNETLYLTAKRKAAASLQLLAIPQSTTFYLVEGLTIKLKFSKI